MHVRSTKATTTLKHSYLGHVRAKSLSQIQTKIIKKEKITNVIDLLQWSKFPKDPNAGKYATTHKTTQGALKTLQTSVDADTREACIDSPVSPGLSHAAMPML